MSETQWTKGPWHIHKYSATTVVGGTGYVVATTGTYTNNRRDQEELRNEQTSNAHLIAAAPDLYAALDRLRGVIESAGVPNLASGVQLGQMSWLHKARDAQDAARAALARARGETA